MIEENARLRARAETAEETTRSLLGAQALLLDAMRSYRAGSERIVAVGQAWEQVTHHQREAISDFQRAAGQFAEAFSAMRDILAALASPDSPEGLGP